MYKSLLSAGESGFSEEITSAWDGYRVQDRAATSEYNISKLCRHWKTHNLQKLSLEYFLRLCG
jgi:hypothetical protein